MRALAAESACCFTARDCDGTWYALTARTVAPAAAPGTLPRPRFPDPPALTAPEQAARAVR
ncbi:hypothetical protein GCM10023082_54380 [Streptomyces tremellae]|uniref:Uncharacterized protein n=1 Tax=Streptomyces tremellae TaxID=1124239 RepID=A0ABP7FZE9_9ACTN